MQADIGPEMATSAAVAPGNMQDMITADQPPPVNGRNDDAGSANGTAKPIPACAAASATYP